MNKKGYNSKTGQGRVMVHDLCTFPSRHLLMCACYAPDKNLDKSN